MIHIRTTDAPFSFWKDAWVLGSCINFSHERTSTGIYAAERGAWKQNKKNTYVVREVSISLIIDSDAALLIWNAKNHIWAELSFSTLILRRETYVKLISYFITYLLIWDVYISSSFFFRQYFKSRLHCKYDSIHMCDQVRFRSNPNLNRSIGQISPYRNEIK